MEAYEASRAVFSRVQSLDPENASKIMGFILLHHGEKDMIRFAYGPEPLIVSIVNRAKTDLGLLSNTSSAPVVSLISNPISISRPHPLSLSLPSPRLPTNGFNQSSSPSSPWSHPHSLSPNSLSYAAVVNGTSNGFSPQYITDPPPKNGEFFDDLAMSPSCKSDSMLYPSYWESSNEGNPHFHRRSASVNDMYYGTDDSTSGFGFKPCLYYARGFCKNGNTCKFVHDGGFSDSPENIAGVVGSPCKYDAFDHCQDDILLRSKFAQQQRLAAQLMAYNKLSFLPTDAQRSATAAALMMGEDIHKLNRVRMARNDFSVMGIRGDANPGSRQIYLTFPADSTFKEEDVSEYFSRFGPVQDVRIPYQQKRMFGFVTFVYPETVNMILAKGNPHFVCDSRVLVKPYKEKGKLPDKKQQQQQQLDRADFSCSSPSGLDCRDPYELGGRVFYNTQEMMLKKKLEEQADLQHTLELQGWRLMNLQLLDMKNQNTDQDVVDESKESRQAEASDEGADTTAVCDGNGNGKVDSKENHNCDESNRLPQSFEHALPDNLFASPTKSAAEQHRTSVFSPVVVEAGGSSTTANNPLNNMASLNKSCFFEMPRLSPGRGAVGL